MKYLIVIEKSTTGFSAYSPDLPGCASIGATREETETNMQEAITFHLEGLKAEGAGYSTAVKFINIWVRLRFKQYLGQIAIYYLVIAV